MYLRGWSWSLLLFFLSAFSGAIASDGEIIRADHSFARVTFSIGCGVSTRKEDRRNLKRSSRSVGYMRQVECIDAGKQVAGVKLIAIAIGKNEKLDLFDVILKIDPDSALKLAKLTDQGNPQPMVLSIKQEAVVASFIQAPFQGDKFWISASTLEDARRMADLFDN